MILTDGGFEERPLVLNIGLSKQYPRRVEAPA